MLSNEDTLQKILEAQQGSNAAAEELLKENMPLIKSIARRYKNCAIEYDDLLQLGSLGLIKAVKRFDVSFNVRFSTYAVPMIAGEIKRHIRDDGPIKVSRQIKSLATKITRYREEFAIKEGREATIAEIAEEFSMTAYDVVFTLDSAKMPVSLYEKYDEDGAYLVDTLKTEDKTEDMLDRIMLEEVIEGLEPREKKIILLRYYRDKTQSEVAKILGVSQVQVSRLESKILEEMKKKMS
ncbi:MAG: SigB/SigF/SigG family RNA polymerase sigma factor [Clostridia bacterium]|nr:SigB/SigF/SigG family RNA polymerase sigma factor [Clostridia bacterium]